MSAPARTTTRASTRRALSRERIVVAALEEVDEQGIDSLTMQGLAHRLGAAPMSLYNHVKNKDDLLCALREQIWAEIAAGAPPADDAPRWLQALGRAIRGAGLRHPHALSLLAAGGVLPPPLLQVVAEQFERAGTTEPDLRLVNGITTVGAFAVGWALTESTGLGPTASGAQETERQRIRRVMRALPQETPDNLVDAAIAVCAAEVEPLFEAGLAAIIAGCGYGAPLSSGQPGPRRRRRTRAT